MRRARRLFRFHDDPFENGYTFAEVSKALTEAGPGVTLADACRAVRRKTHPESAPRLEKMVRCPVCHGTMPEASVRRVALKNGKEVTLYPHPSTDGKGVGRVCRVEA